MSEAWMEIGSLGAGLPAWVGAMTLWAGAVLAAVWAADWLLRRHVAAGWRAGLYLAVVVRVVLPLDWHSPVTLWPAASEAEAVGLGEGSGELVAPDAPALIGSHAEVDAAVGLSTSAAIVTPGHVLAAGYGAGVLGLLGWLLLARRRMGRALHSAIPARPRVAGLAPRVRVLEHDALGPLAFGIVRPVVVLPSSLVDELDDASLACVLAHEVAHLERRDPALALLTAVVSCLAWPVLPVWLAAARVRHLIELAADARALERATPRTYGQTLIRLADRVAPRGPLAAGVYLGSFSRLRGRVAALRERSALPGAVQVGATGAVIVGVLACAGIEGDELEDPDALARRCEVLKERATRLHDQREKTKDVRATAESAQAYDAYAEDCEADPDYAEVLYYRAELMWAKASDAWNAGDKAAAKPEFARAHEAFTRALAEQPERFTQDAAHGQLLAKWNALEMDLDTKPPKQAAPLREPGAPKFPRSEYTPDERELLTTYDAFEAHVADAADPAYQKVLYHRTKLAMSHNRFDEAEAAARALFEGSDGTPRHVWAAEMLTDVLTIAWVDPSATVQQRLDAERALSTWVERVPTMRLYQLEEAQTLRGAVPNLRAGIMWKQGLRALDAGEAERCAETFETLAAEYPEHDKLADIQANAARCRALAER